MLKRLSGLITVIQLALLLTFLLPGSAQAYVDPGSGSVIVTTVLGFLAAIGYTFRKYLYKIKNMIFRNKTEEEQSGQD